MMVLRIAGRVLREMSRDRRTIAFIIVAPIIVMSLLYFALRADADTDIAVVSRGPARLFDYEMKQALADADGVNLVELAIADDMPDGPGLDQAIRAAIIAGEADGVLLLGQSFLPDRFAGEPGDIYLYLEGSKPLVSADVLDAIADAMDELTAALPVVIDAQCSNDCANSVNNKTINVEFRHLYGSDDYNATDLFLPLFPPFFAFFFTFVLAAISFQRERSRGTMDRIFASPVSFLEVVAGYVVGFVGFAGVQAVIILAFVFGLIEFEFSGTQIGAIALCTFLVIVVALLTGLLVSFVAANEFQALQFVPLIVLPQVFLSDMIWPLATFPRALQAIALAMPLTYANRFSRDVLIRDIPMIQSGANLLMIAAFILFLVAVIGIARRRMTV